MATLALAVAGAAVGGAVLPAGVSLLGATLTGAQVGAQIGAFGGSFIDQALFAPSGQNRVLQGPRLSQLRVTSSSEGAPIPRLYGRARLGGQVIWATNFEEEITQQTSQSGSGKGASRSGPSTASIEYRYFANFAVAICEGPISGIARVWADGRELDLSAVTFRLHLGSNDQLPDSLIEAKEGAGNVPAYRGVAYIVFERMALADFGNRLPQLSFEVHRAVDSFQGHVRAVCMIPGAGEFAYASEAVTRKIGAATSTAENVHTLQGGADFPVATDQLAAALPEVSSVSLVVGWFGTDLRAGDCQIRPGVDAADKVTEPLTWSVAGLSRENAHFVSTIEGRTAYGGTPSDQTVVSAIQDLKARGYSVTLAPFIFMDVADGNTLTDPYTGAASQPVYPWRGRITVSPAAGQPGTADKTAEAAAQVAAFTGTAAPSDFAIAEGTVTYTGPDEWSYRRFILHYAHLAVAAGADVFILGSELRGLTQVRESAGQYPFVDALVALAADVKSVVGPGVGVTYAADWSEYFGHQPADGSGDVYFHLDPLWSSAAIDAVGIDVYWPLADWRDGLSHLDRIAGTASIYDPAYLRANVGGGEGYDWYYASPADRDAQIRAPITDGLGKPWMFRFKDVRSWWENLHFDRPAGAESSTPTGWVPQSKPFWLTELGCPAVDKGANQPNVFVDPKSSESSLPFYSRGSRDDFIQRCYLEAFQAVFDPGHPDYIEGGNPPSSVYAGRMVDPGRIHVYAWDARPHPAFPADTEAWGDGDNWRLGHWITGRAASASLAATVGTLLMDYGFSDRDVTGLHGVLGGFVIDRIMPAREALQPLELAFFIDARESGGQMIFPNRGSQAEAVPIETASLVERRPGDALSTLTRGQETELPASAKLTYIAATGNYDPAVEEARRLAGHSGRISIADLPLVLDAEQAAGAAETWLFEAWAARETAAFSLPPTQLALEPGDLLTLTVEGRARLLRITEIGEHGTRDIEARGIDPEIYSGAIPVLRPSHTGSAVGVGRPLVFFVDLPLLRGDEPPYAGYVAAAQLPWPGGVAFYRSPEDSGFVLKAMATVPAITGLTLDDFSAGVTSRLSRATTLRVQLDRGELGSVTELALLGGANAAAIQNADGEWEVLQFKSAQLVEERTYELSLFLRGQAGTEQAMRAPVSAGARFILVDSALARVDMSQDEIGLGYTWKCGPANRDLGHASYIQTAHAFRGLGLKPLSPCHARGSRVGGDLAISWVRRTRTGGDSWEAVEVPLGEDGERYEIDILDGSDVKRTLAATAPAITYTAAEQADDFGAPQPAIAVRIYQLSAVAGRGSPCDAIL